MIKIVAIGNLLLEDDGIGIKVVQAMKKMLLTFSEEVQVVIGETDYYYCLDNIEPKDFVIIVDATYFGIEPGTITTMTLDECDRYVKNNITAHEENLVHILRHEYRDIKGYFIGIEAAAIEFSLELSLILQERFQEICLRVCSEVQELVSEYLNLTKVEKQVEKCMKFR